MKGDCGTKLGEVGEYAFGELGLYIGPPGDMLPAPRGLWPKGMYWMLAASSIPLTARGENAACSALKMPSCHVGELVS